MMKQCDNCQQSVSEEDFRCQNCGMIFLGPLKASIEQLESKLLTLKHDVQSLAEKADTTTKSIEKRIWSKIWKWLGIFSLVWSMVFGYTLYEIHKKVVRRTSTFIAKSINKKFAEPNIRSTLTAVAENEARHLIQEQIQPQIETTRSQIAEKLSSFEVFLNEFRQKIADEYNELARAVSVLNTRNELARLGDEAITQGSRSSFEKLLGYITEFGKDNQAQVALQEVLRVKTYYATMTRIKGKELKLKGPLGNEYQEKDIPNDDLMEALKNNADWRIRARAAILLGQRSERKVPEALLEAVHKDQRLDVVKTALDSFQRITGYESPDVFNYDSAATWWKKNKDRVDERLK